jgi:hypothetical protein
MERSEIRSGIDASRQSRITLRCIRATVLKAFDTLDQPQRSLRIKAESRRQFNQFHHINPSLPGLDGGDVGLRTPDEPRQFMLREIGFLTFLFDEFPQRLVALRP